LIAIHHGLLSLPRVAVEALPEREQTTEDGVAVAPSTETYQVHGAEKVLILPRGGRTTYVVSLGEEKEEE
jgi:trafficking protein particle complex subunit 10